MPMTLMRSEMHSDRRNRKKRARISVAMGLLGRIEGTVTAGARRAADPCYSETSACSTSAMYMVW